ncbi:MAG: type II secretion system protein [Candidatus Moraniibacteriota bacterium]
MKKKLRGFSLFEVILYLGLFSMMATALLQFSWNVLDLGTKDRTARQVFSDARFITERLNSFVRSAESIDTGASTWNDPNGKLVLDALGSSDTRTITIQNGNIILAETGNPDVILNSLDSKVESLTFSKYGSRDETSEYVEFVFIMKSAKNDESPSSQYKTMTTINGGAFIRNSGVGL